MRSQCYAVGLAICSVRKRLFTIGRIYFPFVPSTEHYIPPHQITLSIGTDGTDGKANFPSVNRCCPSVPMEKQIHHRYVCKILWSPPTEYGYARRQAYRRKRLFTIASIGIGKIYFVSSPPTKHYVPSHKKPCPSVPTVTMVKPNFRR